MISIIIPVFNAEARLKDMLDSIRSQTYTDYECILVNDGSTDGSEGICSDYAQKDARFRLYTQKNQGVSAARNYGMHLAKGEYIAFLDADDTIPSNYLMELETVCHTADIGVCDVAVLQDGKETTRFTHLPAVLTQKQALDLLLQRKSINSGPCAKIFHASVLSGLQYPPMKAYEDILFVTEAFSRAGKIAFTNKTVYNYIQNSGSTMSQIVKEPSLDIVTATEKLIEFIDIRLDLAPECFYITISHLFQYALPLSLEKGKCDFLDAAIRVYRKQIKKIVRCCAFSQKEKIVFLLFTRHWVYYNRKLTRIRGY